MMLSKGIEQQRHSIESYEKLKDCLELRLTYLNKRRSWQTEQEKNEWDIERMKTEIEISKLNGILKKKRNELGVIFDYYANKVTEKL